MRCPNCRKKMLKGHLQSSREITWSQKAFTVARTEDVLIAEKKTFGSKTEAYYCDACGTLVVETRERKGLF